MFKKDYVALLSTEIDELKEDVASCRRLVEYNDQSAYRTIEKGVAECRHMLSNANKMADERFTVLEDEVNGINDTLTALLEHLGLEELDIPAQRVLIPVEDVVTIGEDHEDSAETPSNT